MTADPFATLPQSRQHASSSTSRAPLCRTMAHFAHHRWAPLMASPRPPRLVDLGRLQGWAQINSTPPFQVNVARGRKEELANALLCSEGGLRKMTRRYPPLLSMEPSEVLSRMLALKVELPRCDIAAMMYNQPLLFFNQPSQAIVDQVSRNYELLCSELPEVVDSQGSLLVDSLVQERPAVLFIEHDHLLWGLPHLKSISKHSAFPTEGTHCANLIWSFFGKALEDRYNQIF